jgi:hypothetical protein
MTKLWFRFNFLKRGLLLEDKNLPHILSNLLRVKNYSQQWRHHRCYGNNDVSIWPTILPFNTIYSKKGQLPPFFISWNVSISEKWMMWTSLKFCRSKKYLSRKMTFLSSNKKPLLNLNHDFVIFKKLYWATLIIIICKLCTISSLINLLYKTIIKIL